MRRDRSFDRIVPGVFFNGGPLTVRVATKIAREEAKAASRPAMVDGPPKPLGRPAPITRGRRREKRRRHETADYQAQD
jgi:hypothetical protein